MKEIRLASGQMTQVSNEDFDYLNQWLWCITSNTHNIGYAGRRVGDRTLRMHWVVIERMDLIIPEGMEPDHEDQNSLNNQRYNLRIVTKSVNCFNRKIRQDNTSGCKGVTYSEEYNKWVARITVNKSRYYLGRFSSFEEAVTVRLKAEEKYYGKP